jgi:hypothetical protein
MSVGNINGWMIGHNLTDSIKLSSIISHENHQTRREILLGCQPQYETWFGMSS